MEVFITEEVGTTKITTFSCAVCDKLFSTKYNMKRHGMSHSVNQIWCSAWNQYFESQEKSDGRIASKHETYIWEVCGVIFKWKNSLNGHINFTTMRTTSLTCPSNVWKVFIQNCQYQIQNWYLFKTSLHFYIIFLMTRHNGVIPIAVECKRMFKWGLEFLIAVFSFFFFFSFHL